MQHIVSPDRLQTVKKGYPKGKAVLYWMLRDKRVQDNWALIAAQAYAIEHKLPLLVCFHYVGNYPDANIRQYGFMFRGLRETDYDLKKLSIPFYLLKGKVLTVLPQFISNNQIAAIFTDFSPLKVYRKQLQHVVDKITIPVYQVDAHNIVPVWTTSTKQEYAAYTIRPKIHSKLPDFLTEFPKLKFHPFHWKNNNENMDWEKVLIDLIIDRSVTELNWLKPGEKEAKNLLGNFISNEIAGYSENRNDPNYSKISNLSPYLNFGHISPQRVALEIVKLPENENSKAFFEQLVIRRELSDNFCYYNSYYDVFEGFPEWGKKTLNEHRNDEREFVYTPEIFESANTHDKLWNAAQKEMTVKGKMHGYMRMYWAKKILEWSPNPETALQTAIELNDKYELDGRDPNGYTGIAWSIGGIHDRAWFERPVFGKIRYMNYNGCKSKFDIKKYIEMYNI